MANQRVRLGELLVAAQIITRDQLEEALELQKRDGRRLGKLLVQAGLVTETQVTQILSQQLSLPWVSLYHIDFSRQLLDLVPSSSRKSTVSCRSSSVACAGSAKPCTSPWMTRATRPRSARFRSGAASRCAR